MFVLNEIPPIILSKNKRLDIWKDFCKCICSFSDLPILFDSFRLANEHGHYGFIPYYTYAIWEIKKNLKLECAVDGRHRKTPCSRRKLMIFDILTRPKVTSLTIRLDLTWILFYSSSPLIWYTTWPCSKANKCLSPNTPNPNTCAWPRWQNENSVRYVLSFIHENTHTVTYKVWNWLCNWHLMIFHLLTPGPQGWVHKCAIACPIHVSNSLTKFGWVSSDGVWGDSITYGWMDEWMETITISPSLFWKAWG